MKQLVLMCWYMLRMGTIVRLPAGVRVKDACFECSWEDAEDASLLRGVYKHGVGNWDAMRMDPELKLSEVRFLLSSMTIHNKCSDNEANVSKS